MIIKIPNATFADLLSHKLKFAMALSCKYHYSELYTVIRSRKLLRQSYEKEKATSDEFFAEYSLGTFLL